MHLTQLDIEGFRSLASVSWKPGDLNVVIGPNGSGKSNLLRLLEMISAGAQGKLSDYVQSAGGMSALVWDGQARGIRYTLKTLPDKADLPRTAYAVTLASLGQGASYFIMEETLTDAGETIPYLQRSDLEATIYGFDAPITLKQNAVPEGELVLFVADNPLIPDIKIPVFAGYLQAWSIYHTINVSADAAIRQAVVTRHETRVSPNGQNLINVLNTLYTSDREFKTLINSAMRAAFGPDYDELIFPPVSTQRVELQVRWKTLKREQSAADLSDGTLRFLFLLTVLANPHPAPLIAIDEPETGLHPSMLPIIAEYAVEASRRTQVIFTTHSDQFLDAFGETKPTTTIAKWEEGRTTLTTLAEDELAYWLKDYTLGKLFRTGELEALA